MTREKPILFSAEMVRAILEGRKTQTRRIVKQQGIRSDNSGVYLMTWQEDEQHHWRQDIQCPYGQPGHRLWVKETWATKREWDERSPLELPITTDDPLRAQRCIAHLASGKPAHIEHSPVGRGRPSIHMPRWSSRITLEITNVRVERLQDISEEDAIAEGIARGRSDSGREMGWHDYSGKGGFFGPIVSYMSLWESIHGTGSWDNNPWIWVVEFKKL